MSYAGFKICQNIATADVLDIYFLRIDISRTFLAYKYTIIIFISPTLLVAPSAIPIRVSPHTESATGYAISEPTGSNQRCGSAEITVICRLYKFLTFSDVSVLMHQCEVCIYFRMLSTYLYLH